ncbi:hypothetical protein [Paenibacillus sp. XY044]|uniref:hypothetical protein n=1 Tax=Paenibacillus sp. XY044 TaxID=2026089 RepID=UPI000B995EB6|nr:hypothetical protein [Paenibacillus sp. XY044]OZB98508.1 hypothetical protein CJP46_04990 [Paenibacillus sp. XY044]
MLDRYFTEMRKHNHEDELRYRYLIRGVKLLLEQRKSENSKGIQRLRRHRQSDSIQPGTWD